MAYSQKTTGAGLTSAMKTYYEREILEAFQPKTQFYRLAPVRKSIPKGSGKIIEFTRYMKMPYLYTDNTTETTAQQIVMSAQTVTATLHQRDGYVQLSRFVADTAWGDIMQDAGALIQQNAAQTVDVLVRNDIGMAVLPLAETSSINMNNLKIDGGTLDSRGTGGAGSGRDARFWSHDKSAAGDRFPMYHNKTRIAQSSYVKSVAKSGMTVKTILHAASVLTAKDVPGVNGGNYKAIMHPDVSYQMTTLAGFKGWHAYTTSKPIADNPSDYMGTIGKIDIHTSTLAYKFPLSGDTMSTSSGAMYCTLVFGHQAFGVVDLGAGKGKGFQFYLKESGPQSTNDPTNMIKQVAYSVTMAGKILNKSAGLWILTTQYV